MRKLNLGCGSNKWDGFINIDINSNHPADIVRDLELTLPFDTESVDEIFAYDVLEHMNDFIGVMNEISRVLKIGGKVHIRAPSITSEYAFCDPDHKHFFSTITFRCFVPGYSKNTSHRIKSVYKILVSEMIKEGGHCKYCELHHPFDTWHFILEKVKESEKPLPVIDYSKGKRINLGCSYTKLGGYINIDINPIVDPDIVCDIEKGLPFDDESIDEVRADDYMEHVSNFVLVMNEAGRVLKSGGRFRARIPNWKTEAIFGDVDHKRVLTEPCFKGFTKGWTRHLEEANKVFKMISYDRLKEREFCKHCECSHPFDMDHVVLEKI